MTAIASAVAILAAAVAVAVGIDAWLWSPRRPNLEASRELGLDEHLLELARSKEHSCS